MDVDDTTPDQLAGSKRRKESLPMRSKAKKENSEHATECNTPSNNAEDHPQEHPHVSKQTA